MTAGAGQPQRATPLPLKQLLLIGLVQLCEPLCGSSIFPFIQAEIQELGIAVDEKQVGYYAGLIESLFFISSALTVMHWGKLSDRIGRKPVVLMGLVGVSLSMLAFGVSKHLSTLVISRCMAGFLSGNVAITKASVAELTDDSNRPRAMSLQSVFFSTGFTLGPMLGGLLANSPLNQRSAFLAEHPYFLSCGTVAAVPAFTAVVFALFFNETKSPRSDYVALGTAEDAQSPITPDTPSFKEEESLLSPAEQPTYSARELLRMPRVRAAIGSYGSLALCDIAWFSTMTLFLFTSVEVGGLGRSPGNIGSMLACMGFTSALTSFFLVPIITTRFGLVNAYRCCVANYCTLIGALPLMNLFAKWVGADSALVYASFFGMLLLAIGDSLAYACVFVFVANSAPNDSALGTVNGIAQATTSVARAIGPAIFQSLFALTVQHKLFGGYLVYVLELGLVGLAVAVSFTISQNADKKSSGLIESNKRIEKA